MALRARRGIRQWVRRPAQVVLLAVAAGGPSAPACAAQVLTMEVGETRVLAHPGVSRVAVGHGEVLQAVPVDAAEVIVFARTEGETSLHVWARKKRSAYTVRVAPARSRSVRAEVDALLARIPGARGQAVGDQIVIEGNDLSDADHARIAALAQRYPQVLDFTGKVGWDRMVLLDVKVVELPRSRLTELGVRWDGASQGGLTAGWALDAAASGRLAERPGESPVSTALRAAPGVGYVGMNMLLSSRLNLLAQNGEATVLAQPQLLARSGSTAEFLAGGEVPYATVDKDGNASTLFKPYGVSLRITPTIASSGTVRSRIEVEASAVDASVTANGGPALKTRRASTEFNVRSGRTLVIGGFLSRERNVESNGLPGLRDIPLLGALFGARREQYKETELAIFVTPVVVSEDHMSMQTTASRAQQHLQDAFPATTRMLMSEPGGREAATDGAWDPYRGAGSQWATPLPRRGANQYDFKD
ncbi:secretion protein [Bordetella sp. H567]|uniref:type II and III secretion system protein family protein n=1 Tax=Bordetella sp. H567 TaxID=1697043 RepID=UPI00081C5DFE|nr:secretion protein [Bordetella sp. H567]